VPVSTVYVSPNGFIQLSPTPQCAGFFSAGLCRLDTSYRGLLGPLVADYSPNQSPIAVVYLRQSSTWLCVNWIDMPLFKNPLASYTSRLCIYSSGAFAWEFGGLTAGGAPTGAEWMVRGLVVD
jgi:hypothetical protein